LNCGHVVWTPCYQPIEEIRCFAPCKSLLPCGHKCQRLCGEECNIDSCKEKVEKLLICGHPSMAACSESVISIKCEEKCKATLPCGQKCSGTCHKCFQGTLHHPCQEKCKRTYVCGHSCQKKCNEQCGICEKKCEYQCCEAKCDRKCGDPCYECKNKCKLGCKHSKCQGLCSEICDRSPCNYPCDKELTCGHECMGLCGEKCLKACKVCEPNNEIFEIFFGTEDEPEARFYVLECGHVFEIKGLDQYMGYGEEEKKQEEEVNKAIQFKTCPKCKKWITKSNRYQAQIKKTLRHISNVKGKLVKDNSIALEKVKELEIEAQSLMANDNQRLKFWEKIVKNLAKEINPKKKKTEILRQTYYNYYYVIKFSLEYQKNMEYAESRKNEKSFEALGYLLQVKNLGFYYLLNDQVDINDEQWEIVKNKLTVLSIFRQLKTLIQTSPQSKKFVDPYLNEIIKNKFFLDQENIKKCKELMKKYSITREEQVQVIKALNIGSGHVFTCPNGHYYVIGDCGGAMEVSRCPECNSQIGGNNHELLQGNRHTGDLDGSNYPAFSNEANMNVGFGNLH